MIENHVTTNGHVRRNYKRTRQRTGPVTQWLRMGWGRFAKCLLTLISEEKVKVGETYSRKFRESGLSESYLYERITYFMPWLPRLYLNARGKPLTPGIVYDRWHKQLYNTRSGSGNSYTVGQSHEHARNDKRLIPLLSYVEELYKEGRPLSQKQVAQACHKIGIEFGRITA
jgi:hypothetical protein